MGLLLLLVVVSILAAVGAVVYRSIHPTPKALEPKGKAILVTGASLHPASRVFRVYGRIFTLIDSFSLAYPSY